MEIRKNNWHRVYDIDPICTYPRQRIIPEIKRNGFDGNLHGILPYDFFKAILSDSKAETLLKAGQYPTDQQWTWRSNNHNFRKASCIPRHSPSDTTNNQRVDVSVPRVFLQLSYEFT